MKKQDVLVLILLAAAAVFAVCFFVIPEIESQNIISSQNLSDEPDLSYESRYFNPDRVNTLNVIMDEREWDAIINKPLAKKYVPCDIELNGDVYHDVGIKTNGGYGSLQLVAENTTSQRYQFKFSANEFVPNATFRGLDKFIIKNMRQDKSYSRDYLYYEFSKKLGIASPDYSYVSVYLNGEYLGLYLMLESIDESFASRNYNNKSVHIYRPTIFKYKGNDASEYSDIWKTVIFNTVTDKDKQRIINAIKEISSKSDTQKYVDTGILTAYFAMMTATVNTDSYINGNNYFLSESDGILSLIPWDNDLSFGKYMYVGRGAWTTNGEKLKDSINFPIDSPIINRVDIISEITLPSLDDLPLLTSILSDEQYNDDYHSLLEKIATEFLGDYMAKRIDYIDSLIGEYVEADPTKFVSYAGYKEDLQNLKKFGYLRAESILGQLNGTIPSTWNEQEENPDSLITWD